MSAKIKVDFNGPVLAHDKKPLFTDAPETTFSSALAGILTHQTEGPVVKMVLWCYRLGEDGFLELDESDFKTLYEIIDKSRQIAMVKGQLMLLMDRAKAESAKVE